MFESEVTLQILNQQEELLGSLHPKYTDVEETIDMNGLRSIKITHPLYDNDNKPLNHYNNLLNQGNKVWWDNTPNGDGCLYVLMDDKIVDQSKGTLVITAEEVASELNNLPPNRFTATSRVVDETYLNTYSPFTSLFTPGTIEPVTLVYTGVVSIMAAYQLIASQGNKEVQYRYEYDPDGDIIHRYIDIVTTKGKTHLKPIEVGYNTDNILLDETEATVAIAAAPTGKPSDTQTVSVAAFNTAHTAFEAMTITAGEMIPSSVDSSGVAGPSIPAPYAKSAGTNYIQCPVTDSAANYKTVQQKEKQSNQYPRTITFDTSETNIYNLYWLCVTNIKAKQQPGVTLTAQVIDIPKLKGEDPEYYNAGDTVYLKMPGRVNRVSARVINTVKNPRTPDKDKLVIGNYVLNFFTDYLNINTGSLIPYK